MCIIYLFSGIGKLQGERGWTGEASLAFVRDARVPVARHDLAGQLSAAAELHDARHGVLGAVVLRAGLAAAHPAVGAADGRVRPRRHRLFLGMPTFGLVMLIGNLAFVSPKTVRKVFDPIARRISLAVVGKASRAGGGD